MVTWFQSTSPKLLANYKSEIDNFMVEKLRRYCLNQMIKVKIINIRMNWNHAPPEMMQQEQCHFHDFLPVMHTWIWLCRYIRQTQIVGQCTKYEACNLQKCQGYESQGKTEELFQIKENRWLKLTFDSELEPFPIIFWEQLRKHEIRIED